MPSLTVWVLATLFAIWGMAIRSRGWSFARFTDGVAISTGLMLLVGIYYLATYYDGPQPHLMKSAPLLMMIAAGTMAILGPLLSTKYKFPYSCLMYLGGLVWAFILMPLSLIMLSPDITATLMPFIILILFVVVGFASAVFGSLIVAYSLAFTVDSLFRSGGIDQIHLWRDLFEFFDISIPGLKLAMVIGSTAGTAYELIAALRSR